LNCNGKGDCQNGKCECYAGFSGIDCADRACPIICNAHGKLEKGKCVCDSQWQGIDCATPIGECEVPDCNGNGECIRGACVCTKGFGGKNCEQIACPRDCSNNGVCIMPNAECKCFANYTGVDCSKSLPSISDICSNHGDFDYERKSCTCNRGWSGADCSRNDHCLDKLCSICKNGWSGMNCMQAVPYSCDPRCNQHGLCVNGTCICSPGYQGRNCEINSCPNACSSNGICEKSNEYNYYSNTRYHCVCNPGWTGKACEIAIEMFCNDDLDNDNGITFSLIYLLKNISTIIINFKFKMV
jgi:hypothetical protein